MVSIKKKPSLIQIPKRKKNHQSISCLHNPMIKNNLLFSFQNDYIWTTLNVYPVLKIKSRNFITKINFLMLNVSSYNKEKKI